MELKEALQKSLKADKHTHSDPFLLHSRVCDLLGGGADKAISPAMILKNTTKSKIRL